MKTGRKLLAGLSLLSLVILFTALPIKVFAQAAQLLGNNVNPRITIISDNSGSMMNQVPLSGSSGPPWVTIPGCVGDNCDGVGAGSTRMDLVIAIVRSMLDADDSASSGVPPGFGSSNSIKPDDNLHIHVGLINFQDGGTSGEPRILDQSVCGGTSTIRYRVRDTGGDNPLPPPLPSPYPSTADYMPIEQALQTFQPGGNTPTRDALNFFRTNTNALPWFAVNDPAFACRKQYVLLITDGEANCDTWNPMTDAQHVVTEAQAIYNTYSGASQVKVFGVGFAAGMSDIGKRMLNEVAKVGGTDSNADGDGNPNTGWYLGTAGTCTTCPGNAFLVNNGEDLKAAMRNIFDQISAGSYSLSLPRLTLSGDGTGAVIAAYFEVGKFPGYPTPWTPGLKENLLDETTSPPQPIIPKWDAFLKVGAQHSFSGSGSPVTGDRVNYSLKSDRTVIPFSDANIGNGREFDTSAFFQPPDNILDDFDSDGANRTEYDAKNIGRFLNGVTTRVQGGPQSMRIQSPHIYDQTKFPFGSIYHAQPLSVTRPSNPFYITRPDYLQFVADRANRDRIVIVGTNSIIAAINDVEPGTTSTNGFNDGDLLWGYVPRLNLNQYRNVNLKTILLNDGNGIAVDYNAGPEDATDWQTGFFTGLGLGGRGVVAINITDTANPGVGRSGSTNNTIGNWEFTDDNLGFTTAPPTLIEVKDRNFDIIHPVIVVPGGSPDTSDPAHKDNSRFVYFLNAVDGTSVRLDFSSRPLPVPLGIDQGSSYNNHFSAYTPAGMTTKAAPVDYDGDGFADQVFLGTAGGQVYRIAFTDYQSLQDTSLHADTIWEPRVLAENGALHVGSNPVTCPAPGSDCDMQNPTDLPVANVLPYFDRGLHLHLAVYFGNPEGDDRSNLADDRHYRGAILRFLRVDPIEGAIFNNEIRFNEDAGNLAKQVFNFLADPADPLGATSLEGPTDGTLMPRQLYEDRANLKSDRVLSWPSMFVLDHKLYYMIYRPDPSPCASMGHSYFACLNLDDGTDCNINPANPSGTPNAANNSVENFIDVAASPASFVINFATHVVTFAWADPTTGLHLQNQRVNLNGPFQGVLQSLIQTGMM